VDDKLRSGAERFLPLFAAVVAAEAEAEEEEEEEEEDPATIWEDEEEILKGWLSSLMLVRIHSLQSTSPSASGSI
jgi:hypothetical protein